MKRIFSLYCFLFLYTYASAASAGMVDYEVTVDTSNIAGTHGSLDLNFNPGPMPTPPASLKISAFSGDSALTGKPDISGTATGQLPQTVTIVNKRGLNDYFQEITFGKVLKFRISFSGKDFVIPQRFSERSGSSLAFSLFSDAKGTKPVLASDADGLAFVINFNPVGTPEVINYSTQTKLREVEAASENDPHAYK